MRSTATTDQFINNKHNNAFAEQVRIYITYQGRFQAQDIKSI